MDDSMAQGKKHRSPDKVISGLERLGAYDDFQVLNNVIVG
jgi:hypothetical protein